MDILLKERADDVLLAVVDDEIVATKITSFDSWRGNTYRLGVLPAYRGRVIARMLLRETEHRLVTQGWGWGKWLVALASSRSGIAGPFWGAMASDRWRPSHPAARYAKPVDR